MYDETLNINSVSLLFFLVTGIHNYTLGQRTLICGLPCAMFVAEKDLDTNDLKVVSRLIIYYFIILFYNFVENVQVFVESVIGSSKFI